MNSSVSVRICCKKKTLGFSGRKIFYTGNLVLTKSLVGSGRAGVKDHHWTNTFTNIMTIAESAGS